MSKVAVIGGGISGIASAYYLNQHHVDVDLYDAAESIGGRIGSGFLDDRPVDFGGKNIGRKYKRFRSFVSDYGDLPFEYFGFNTSQVIGRKIIKINKEKAGLYNLIRLFYLSGLKGFVRLYPLVQAVKSDYKQGALNSSYFNHVADQNDHHSLSVFFGKRCARYLIRPVTVRMNGAEPDECYPGNFGSNLALALDSYEQLQGGMSGLLQAFSTGTSRTRVFTGYNVHRLEFDPGSSNVIIKCYNKAKNEELEYKKVLLALPAKEAAPLFKYSLPELSEPLETVMYYPVAVAIAKYQKDVFQSDLRAMVFDNSSLLSNAGAYGINDLDLVRYTFSGIAARKLISSETNSENVISIAEEIIEKYFNVKGNTRESYVYKYLDPGLCAYSPYHYKLLEKIEHILNPFRNISLAGDYWRGASIEACFRSAEEAVRKLIYENAPQA
ncbi:MAG: FAD-dependent oxidoreductase [Chlorobiales bacterium]|nr:FAD-dependent oxidoreductase [Chlorobiales bacterium]